MRVEVALLMSFLMITIKVGRGISIVGALQELQKRLELIYHFNHGSLSNETYFLQIRTMLRDVAHRNEIFRDDQQVFVRYLLENPHLVSIDVDRKLFLTGYKEPMEKYSISFILDFYPISETKPLSHGTICLLHCNSKDSNNAYYRCVRII